MEECTIKWVCILNQRYGKSLLKFSKTDLSFTVADGCFKIKHKLFSCQLFCVNFTNIGFELIDFFNLVGSCRLKEWFKLIGLVSYVWLKDLSIVLKIADLVLN